MAVRLFYAPDILTTPELPADEAAHALRVLRLRVGDELTIVDGRGNLCDAVISATDGRGRCQVDIRATHPQAPLWTGHLHIALAPTKNVERTEWLVEKATEVGVDEITFLDCHFSERRSMKLDRMERIVVAAAKQSLKARLPRLNPMTPFRDFVNGHTTGQRFIAHCHNGDRPLLSRLLSATDDTTVLIGPEGDFSADEVTWAEQCGYLPISLGRARLRTETAALVACTLMSLAHQVEGNSPDNG